MPYSSPLFLLALGLALSAQAQSAHRLPLVAQQLPASLVVPTGVATYHLTGRVYSPAGRPLPGATVSVKGTGKVVSTDAAGRYSLELPAQAPAP